jgi:hypothetical protein
LVVSRFLRPLITNHQSPLTVPPAPGDDGVLGVNLLAPGF